MYRVVVGIEVHVQIKTKTKAFCRCLNTISIEPNKNICPICEGGLIKEEEDESKRIN